MGVLMGVYCVYFYGAYCQRRSSMRMQCPLGHLLGPGVPKRENRLTICDECGASFQSTKRFVSCKPCDYDICLGCVRARSNENRRSTRAPLRHASLLSKLVISAHGDHNFSLTNCLPMLNNDELLYGHFDNSAGVYAVMRAYFNW